MRAYHPTDAALNLQDLQENPYPGRGFIVGISESGTEVIMVYWINGRSSGSKDRKLVYDNGRVFTQALDPTAPVDPHTIYNAMREDRHALEYVVSNGSQTDAVIDGYDDITISLRQKSYESEKHHTPRITAICVLDEGETDFTLSILRKSPWDNSCDQDFFRYRTIKAGLGLCLHTYSGVPGDPLPSFVGRPFPLPLVGNANTIAAMYWEALSRDTRVGIAVKSISIDSGESDTIVINQFG